MSVRDHYPAPGVYCVKHSGHAVMACRKCKVLWSPCCDEEHTCAFGPARSRPKPAPHPTVQASGADLIPEAARLRRGSTLRTALKPVGAGLDPLDGWLGWE